MDPPRRHRKAKKPCDQAGTSRASGRETERRLASSNSALISGRFPPDGTIEWRELDPHLASGCSVATAHAHPTAALSTYGTVARADAAGGYIKAVVARSPQTHG